MIHWASPEFNRLVNISNLSLCLLSPLTKVRLINELNEREADLGINESVSWHSEYKDSAWVFIGGFPYELTEGDIICVFSQYGEIANINLVRDKKTGKSKGFCFLCYEDQRSTILAVDNFNGIKIKGRTIRVDHVANYRPPKDSDDIDDITKSLREEGCAPKIQSSPSSESEDDYEKKKKKKEKKEKKKAQKEERRDDRAQASHSLPMQVKKEKEDAGYDKYTKKGPEKRKDWPRAREEPRPWDNRGKDWEKDRERDRDKEREKAHNWERERERERNRERERDRYKDNDRGRKYR
uniref:RNA-binding motif protein, X-linked 2 n=1 Tax=Denticeps clupeoides TaxID=299321 RepID=A0AAY4EAM7_9TELE